MKNKIIIFLFLSIIFAPVVSRAIPVPTANLIIVVNTQSDSSFYFHLTGAPDFDLQTSNLTAPETISIFYFSQSYVCRNSIKVV